MTLYISFLVPFPLSIQTTKEQNSCDHVTCDTYLNMFIIYWSFQSNYTQSRF